MKAAWNPWLDPVRIAVNTWAAPMRVAILCWLAPKIMAVKTLADPDADGYEHLGSAQ